MRAAAVVRAETSDHEDNIWNNRHMQLVYYPRETLWLTVLRLSTLRPFILKPT